MLINFQQKKLKILLYSQFFLFQVNHIFFHSSSADLYIWYIFFLFIFRGFKQMKYFHPFLLRGFILTYIHFFPLDLYILDKFIHLFFPWNAKYEIHSFIHLRVFIHMKHIHSIRFCGFIQMIYTHSFIFHRKFYHSSLLRGFILKKYFHSFIYLWI